jgi:hypothetical protein
MIRRFCEWLAKHLPSITIPTPDGKPYLTRYYLFGADRKWGNIFLHHFHSSDMDIAPSGAYYLHNHPWPWSFSIILVGGYNEYRMVSGRKPDEPYRYIWKTFLPGSINFLTDADFHRVELLDQDGWSFFFTGWRSKKRSWGFWDPKTSLYTDFTSIAKAVA